MTEQEVQVNLVLEYFATWQLLTNFTNIKLCLNNSAYGMIVMPNNH